MGSLRGDCGGNSSAVQDQLSDIQQIQASTAEFAGIRKDGSVVLWGFFPTFPGDVVLLPGL